MTAVVVPVVLALALAAFLPVLVVPALRAHGVVDLPGHRSSHRRPTVRGTGIALLTAVAGATVGAAVLGRLDAAAVLGLAAALAVVGMVEDLHGLSVRARLAGQVLLTVVGVLVVPVLGGGPWWLVVIAALVVPGYVNAANFMDGVNGISGLQGTVTGLYAALVGLGFGVSWLVVVGLVQAAVFAAFLPWNLCGRGAFLGDSGSYLLGALVALSAFGAYRAGVPLLVAVAPLLVYTVDTGVTLVRRVVRREIWWSAHREHVYQRLARGTTHLVAASVVTAFTAAVCAIAVLAGTPVLAGLLCLAVAAAYVGSPAVLRHRSVGVR